MAPDPDPQLIDAIRELREEYRPVLAQSLDELRATLTRARVEGGAAVTEVRRLAHRLHGTAGSYGFRDAGDAAGEIEHAMDALLAGKAAASAAFWDHLAAVAAAAPRE